MDSPIAGDALGAEPKKKDARSARSKSVPFTALFQDLAASLRNPGFWLYGAWIDTSLRYRSQAFGPMWMIFGTAVFVLVLGSLYSQIFRGNSPVYFGHLATGYVFWIFMQQLLVQSAALFPNNRNMIQNGYVKYADYELRLFVTGLIGLAHNLLVVVGAMVFTQIVPTSAALMLLITVPLLMVTLLGTTFLFSILGARYPDFSELLRTLLRLGFFVTPIIWTVGAAGKGALIGPFLYLNPFYYFIEIIRGPLIYGYVPWIEIGAVAAAAVVVWLMACAVYARAKPYIPLWI